MRNLRQVRFVNAMVALRIEKIPTNVLYSAIISLPCGSNSDLVKKWLRDFSLYRSNWIVYE